MTTVTRSQEDSLDMRDPPEKVRTGWGKWSGKSSGLRTSPHFFRLKSRPGMLKEQSESLRHARDEVAPDQDPLLARPDGRAALFLLPGRGSGQDPGRDPGRFAGVAGGEPYPGARDLFLPSRALGLDLEAGRARRSRPGIHRH